ncbi:MAG: hypothetical protein HY861_04245 [Chlamydiia bacterium]|nr:hypothetical protein [Chlamydiia bacterium]
MTFRQAFQAVVQLFTVLFVFVVGVFFLELSLSEQLRLQMATALMDRFSALQPIGLGFVATACLLFAFFFSLHRKAQLCVREGPRALSIDAGFLRRAIDERFKRQFAGQVQVMELEILRGKVLEVAVRILSTDGSVQEKEIASVHKELKILLWENFGCSGEIILSVSTG